MGRCAGVEHLRPHKLRHSAVTTALGATHGDVMSVSRFSRHSSVQTVTVYADNLGDVAGSIAEQVAASNGSS